MRKLNFKTKAVVVTAIAGSIFFSASSCDGSTASDTSGQSNENKVRQSNYDRLVTEQPAHTMNYSPTRATKNFWIDTWGKKGKLAYVYLLNSEGKPFGYYITVGLPVNYCTSLIPPYQIKDYTYSNGSYGGGNAFAVPGPSIDGTYSSSSNCDEFYGKDASSGAFVEYHAGFGINPFIYDQPQQQFAAAQPLGDATVANVKSK